MSPRFGMGPFMALGKRPGERVIVIAPQPGPRPTLIAWRPRRPMADTNDFADTARAGALGWRYRA